MQQFQLKKPRDVSIQGWREELQNLIDILDKALHMMKAHSTLDIQKMWNTADAKFLVDQTCEALSAFLSTLGQNHHLNGYDRIPEIYVKEDHTSLKERIAYVLRNRADVPCQVDNALESCWDPVRKDWERIRRKIAKYKTEDKDKLTEYLNHITDDSSSDFELLT